MRCSGSGGGQSCVKGALRGGTHGVGWGGGGGVMPTDRSLRAGGLCLLTAQRGAASRWASCVAPLLHADDVGSCWLGCAPGMLLTSRVPTGLLMGVGRPVGVDGAGLRWAARRTRIHCKFSCAYSMTSPKTCMHSYSLYSFHLCFWASTVP